MTQRHPSWRVSRRRFLAGSALAALPRTLVAGGGAPDTILTGGEIHVVDGANNRFEALAMRAGKILAVGSDAQISALAGPTTRHLALDGRTVLPGVNDSHLHLLMWGLAQPPFEVNVAYPNVGSIADIVRVVGAAAQSKRPGEWILGRGWDQPYFAEGRAPTAADLDALTPDNPVALTEFSGHAVWANTKAMQMLDIAADTPVPEGGVIVTDEQGKPTGVFFESAAWLITRRIPPPSASQQRGAIVASMSAFLARGITSATDPWVEPDVLALYADVAAAQGAKLRMTTLVRAGMSVAELTANLAQHAAVPNPDPRWLQKTGVKIMGDGIPTLNKTAWLNEPYEGGGNGTLSIAGENDAERVSELEAMIALIHDRGLQIGTHATGDRTIDAAVGAYAKAQQANPRKDPRHYIIHGDLISPATLGLMARHGVGANFNPEIKHMIADGQVEALGELRASYEWPYRTALDTGVTVASSSDAPVTPGSWLQGLATCVDRVSQQTGRVSGPEQRITLDEAIRTYTIAGAWQDHADDYKGSLEPGKVADLVILDERLTSVETSVYPKIQIAATFIDGQQVFDSGLS